MKRINPVEEIIKGFFIIIGFITVFCFFGVCGNIETQESLTAELFAEYVLCFIVLILCGVGYMAIQKAEDMAAKKGRMDTHGNHTHRYRQTHCNRTA